MMVGLLVLLGVAFVTAEILMLICWLIYLFQRKFSIVDIGWTASFFFITLIYAILGEGFLWRKILVFLIASLWSLRLAFHLLSRYCRQGEDPRYNRLIKIWFPNRRPFSQAFLLFTLQGAIASILSLPFLLMCQNPFPCFGTPEIFGLLIWMAGIVGESVSDRQLDQFKRHAVHPGDVCEEGLWRYSRHPNYFFEWTIWLGYFLMALASPWGWLSIISPVLILYLLLKVSGIPPAEEQALETKGDAYRSYQSRVSPFFLWFRHNDNHVASSDTNIKE